jgi:hypothetical protein
MIFAIAALNYLVAFIKVFLKLANFELIVVFFLIDVISDLLVFILGSQILLNYHLILI